MVFFPTASAPGKAATFAIFVLAAAVIAILRVTRGRGKLTQEEKQFAVIYATPVLCLTLLGMLFSCLVSLRYYTVALTGFVLLMVALCCNSRNNRTTLAVIGGMIGFFLSCSVTHEVNFSKSNWKKLCRYLESQEEPGDLILFFNSITYQSLCNSYYRGSNPLHALPHEPTYDGIDAQSRVIRSEEQIIAYFEKRKNTTGRVWLIGREDVFGPEPGGFNLNGEILKKYLEDRFELALQRPFENTAVVRLFVGKSTRP